MHKRSNYSKSLIQIQHSVDTEYVKQVLENRSPRGNPPGLRVRSWPWRSRHDPQGHLLPPVHCCGHYKPHMIYKNIKCKFFYLLISNKSPNSQYTWNIMNNLYATEKKTFDKYKKKGEITMKCLCMYRLQVQISRCK